VLEHYKFRDGPSLCQIVDVQKRRLLKTMLALGENSNSYDYTGNMQTYIANACVKGGKWYYEVKLVDRAQFLCIGWCTRDYRANPNQGMQMDMTGQSWCVVGPSTQYMHRRQNTRQASMNYGVYSNIPRWEPGTVIGVYLDTEKREIRYSYDGKEDDMGGIPFSQVEVGDGLYPCVCVSTNSRFDFNLGRKAFANPPDPKGRWAPMEHPGVHASSWIEKYRVASDVTHLVYSRATLPDKVIDDALENELSSLDRDSEMRFEAVQTDENRLGGGASHCSMLMTDDQTYYNPIKTHNFHITLKLAGGPEAEFILREVKLRTSIQRQSGFGVTGLVFISDKKPDMDSFEWCNDFSRQHYNKFVQRKKQMTPAGKNTVYLPHEPVGYFQAAQSSNLAICKLDMPMRAKYVTLKISTMADHMGLALEHIGIKALPGAHPLGSIIGTPAAASKIKEIVLQLRAGAFWGTDKQQKADAAAAAAAVKNPMASAAADHPGKDLVPSGADAPKKPEDAAAAAAPVPAGWRLEMDEALVALLQTLASRLGVSPMAFDAIMLAPTDDDLARFKAVGTTPLDAMRARISLLKYMNRLVMPLLHYVDVSVYDDEAKYYRDTVVMRELKFLSKLASAVRSGTASPQARATALALLEKESADERHLIEEDDALLRSSSAKEGKDAKDAKEVDALGLLMGEDNSLSYVVHKIKGLYFMSTKKSVFDALLNSQSVAGYYSPPRITINRIKAAKARERDTASGTTSNQGQDSVFGQIFNALRGFRYESFQTAKKDTQMWNVTFAGEGSIDVGGPYRESATNICSDLMSITTPLFVRCPNGKNGVGLNREKWIPNVSANTSLHFQMFEFLGALMGIALRTKAPLPIDVPSVVWKLLLNQRVEVSDLEAIDRLAVQALNGMVELTDRSKFDLLVTSETFTAQLTNGETVELKKEGANTQVTFDNRHEYAELSIQARLKEATKQVLAMQKGLNAVVPVRFLSLFSWFDLEVQVCGNPVIDIEMLLRHTLYSSTLSAAHPLVQYLFEALRSFNQEERQMFLRFVWGRNRLPAADSDWSQQFTVNPLSADEKALPIAHTCFFSIDLPPYPNAEVLRAKLLYAIYNCTAIDVDFNPNQSSLNAWID